MVSVIKLTNSLQTDPNQTDLLPLLVIMLAKLLKTRSKKTDPLPVLVIMLAKWLQTDSNKTDSLPLLVVIDFCLVWHYIEILNNSKNYFLCVDFSKVCAIVLVAFLPMNFYVKNMNLYLHSNKSGFGRPPFRPFQ